MYNNKNDIYYIYICIYNKNEQRLKRSRRWWWWWLWWLWWWWWSISVRDRNQRQSSSPSYPRSSPSASPWWAADCLGGGGASFAHRPPDGSMCREFADRPDREIAKHSRTARGRWSHVPVSRTSNGTVSRSRWA